MKPSQMTTLALRVLAIYILAWGSVRAVQSWVHLLNGPTAGGGLPPGLALAIVIPAPVVVAALLWVLAPALGRLASRRVHDRSLARLDAGMLGQATFAVAGVLLLFYALPSVVQGAIIAMSGHHGPITSHLVAWLVSGVFRCLLGIILIVGSRPIMRGLLALRYVGTPKPAPEGDQSRGRSPS